MSSFPILRLPRLALDNVFVFWNACEIYQFSELSERNKKITKSHCSKKFLLTNLKYEGKQSLVYRCEEYYSEDYTFNEIPVKTACCFTGISMFEEAFNIIQGINYLFGHPLTYISINADDTLSSSQLESLLFGINSMNQEFICSVDFKTKSMEHLEIFLQNYKKPTNLITIELSSNNQSTPSFLKEYKQPEAVYIQCDTFRGMGWMSIEQLLVSDFKRANFTCKLTSEDLNVFLKSWQTGTSHLRMKRFTVYNETFKKWIMNTVLDGLSPIIEYPRIIGDNQGQCQIARSDGKIAILEFNMHGKGHFEIYIDCIPLF